MERVADLCSCPNPLLIRRLAHIGLLGNFYAAALKVSLHPPPPLIVPIYLTTPVLNFEYPYSLRPDQDDVDILPGTLHQARKHKGTTVKNFFQPLDKITFTLSAMIFLIFIEVIRIIWDLISQIS